MLIDVVMPMYNSLEYSNNYPKIFGILWKIYRDVPAVINNNEIFDFHASNVILGRLILNLNYLVEQRQCNKNVEIMIPLKYLSNFWRTLEMSLINCGTSLALNFQ